MGQGSDVWELLAVALREAVVGPMILKMHHFSSLGGLRERKRESEGGRGAFYLRCAVLACM